MAVIIGQCQGGRNPRAPFPGDFDTIAMRMYGYSICIAPAPNLCYNYGMKKFFHIALLLLLTAHGWAEGAVTYACRMTGEVSNVCCCPSSDQPDCDVIKAAHHCCDVHVNDATAVPAGVRPVTSGLEDNHHPAWVAYASFASLLQPKMPEGFARAAARFDSSSPPPIILLTQSIRC